MNKVAILGYGNIGHGVKEMLANLPETVLLKVFDVPAKKAELGVLYAGDIPSISEDPSVDTVFECLGGDELPYQAICACLKAGKNVISSNKETISRHLKEYQTLVERYHASLQFEASVGGGIPLLYPLSVVASFDSLVSLQGILNGTSNYIITAMEEKGMSFAEALKQAQDKGFAEKDPTADLEGLDLVRKCSILASLITHEEVDNATIPHWGISHLDGSLITAFKKENKALRLLVDIHPYQGSYSLAIMPTLLERDSFLAQVKEETNALSASFLKNGPLTFVGKGAGRYPTASAMISDFIRVKQHAVLPLTQIGKRLNPILDLSGRYVVWNVQKSLQILVNPSLDELKRYAFVARLA
jgi:Homoserine dehydrogenase